MQLQEMNVGKASPTLHDVSISSATTEEFHSQQLMQVRQLPQVHVNAAFPQSLAAVMFISLRYFERAILELQMNKKRTRRTMIWNSEGSRFSSSNLAQVRSAKPKSQSRFQTSSGTQRISMRLGPQIQT